MKKKYLIIAMATFSFFAGISKTVQAQDTTLSFGKYLIETPWVISFGLDFIDDDGKLNPFKYRPWKGATPFRLAMDKPVYGFRHWKHTEHVTAQLVIASTSLQYRTNTMVDLNLKYDFLNTNDKVNLYALLGGGYSYNFPLNATTGTKKGSSRDQFLNVNIGGGLDYWMMDNIGINVQGQFKQGLIGGFDRYLQYTAALLFKIGGDTEKEKATSTYIRSKEAEDALIHLREHINK